jgi:hypothetical protein
MPFSIWISSLVTQCPVGIPDPRRLEGLRLSTSKSTTAKCPIALLSDRHPTRSTLSKPIVSATASRWPAESLERFRAAQR